MQDVGRNLPVHAATGKLMPHHWTAERLDLWNADKRFDDFQPPLSEEPLILYVGGNTHAEDGRRFLEKHPKAHIHIYEPVPSYVESLREVWKDAGPHIHIHGVGLGNASQVLLLSSADLDGQGTYIMDSVGQDVNEENSEDVRNFEVRIVDVKTGVDHYIREQGGKPMLQGFHSALLLDRIHVLF